MGNKEQRNIRKLIPREEAEKLLEEWAEFLELDPDGELYEDVVKELRMSVRTQRLSFDFETRTFKYMLITPVGEKGIVELKDCDFRAKEVIENYKKKETVKASRALLSTYADMTIEQTAGLKTKDSNIMTAVTLGFLAQTVPRKKEED